MITFGLISVSARLKMRTEIYTYSIKHFKSLIVIWTLQYDSVFLPHNKASDDWLTVCVVWSSALCPCMFRPSSIWLCGSGTKSDHK